MSQITYRIGNDIPVDVAKVLYEASTLGQRRPINDPGTLEAMETVYEFRIAPTGD